ncbi:MAG: nicotinate (nicotinamide) nucleotide adenylyltransferase [Bacteroidales bacterium]
MHKSTNKRVALYFGSFNPVHIGHLAISSYIIDKKLADELWFVLTPLNPLKEQKNLWDNGLRLSILEQSIDNKEKLSINTIEFDLPKPSYTVNTLRELENRHKSISFSIIIGSDNWAHFDKWKDYQHIISSYNILIYPRASYHIDIKTLPDNTRLLDAPIISISSTQIREMLDTKEERVLDFLHPNTHNLIRGMFLNPSSS